MTKTLVWGGKRPGAGRKKVEQQQKTVVVRVAEALVPVINAIKLKYKVGCSVENLIKVTENQNTEQQADSVSLIEGLQEKIRVLEAKNSILETTLASQRETNLNLVYERDREHFEAVQAQNSLKTLKLRNQFLKRDYDELLHREHSCMAIKADGTRCTRQATLDHHKDGVVIRVCVQHAKVAKNIQAK